MFYVDPAEDMIVLSLAQLVPSDHYPIRRQLQVLSNQCIVDDDVPCNMLSYWEVQ